MSNYRLTDKELIHLVNDAEGAYADQKLSSFAFYRKAEDQIIPLLEQRDAEIERKDQLLKECLYVIENSVSESTEVADRKVELLTKLKDNE